MLSCRLAQARAPPRPPLACHPLTEPLRPPRRGRWQLERVDLEKRLTLAQTHGLASQTEASRGAMAAEKAANARVAKL